MTRTAPLPLLFALACSYPTQPLRAQITDDFSDGNLTQNPAWQGDPGHFKINAAGELQLAAPAAGTSSLATSGIIPDSAVWTLDFRLEFAASAQNRLRIYLLADDANLSFSNAYLLEIGETGSNDALRFFKQTAGGASILLASGTPGGVGGDPVEGQIRVKKSSAGLWQIEYAAGAGGVFEPQLSVSDGSFSGGPGRFFGFVCTYTDSRKDKFFFDNLSIQPDLPDTTPPVLKTVKPLNDSTLHAFFDEKIDPVVAEKTSSYLLSGGIAQPSAAVFDAAEPNAVRLFFSKKMKNGQAYSLSASGATDLAGNVAGTQTIDFQFVENVVPGEFSVLINEIMADPTPSAGLPETEWLELFNASDQALNLSELSLSDDSGNPKPLPDFVLQPQSFAVLCPSANAALLVQVPDLVPLASFPSLNNDADALTLTNKKGVVVDHVVYAASWHSDPAKQSGGWSLERINPQQPCLGAANWASARNPPGGTPGAQNSVFDGSLEAAAPEALWVNVLSASTLRVVFSENLHPAGALHAANFSTDPPLGITSVAFAPGSRSELIFLLADPIQTGQIYLFSMTDEVQDCNGRPVFQSEPLRFGLPEKPDFQDVVINEILFNPASGGSRYLEVFNRSQRVFSLADFFIGDFSGSTTEVKKVESERLFFPGEHVVFATDTADVAARYFVENQRLLLKNALPTFAEDAGNATFYWSKNGQTVVLDSLDYEAAWHNPLVSTNDADGFALERIRPDAPTNRAENWTSAAPKNGLGAGTPTARNSQFQAVVQPAVDEFITLISNRLSPDNDGLEDFLEMAYALPKPGFAATISIFDSEGVPVKKLVRQELLGTEGTLRWDGNSDDGEIVRPGIYVVFIEIFHPDGEVRRVKKAVAVVGRF